MGGGGGGYVFFLIKKKLAMKDKKKYSGPENGEKEKNSDQVKIGYNNY